MEWGLLLAAGLWCAPRASGQGGLDVSWSPPLIDVVLAPLEETELDVTLSNDSTEPLELSVELTDVEQVPGGGYAPVERGTGSRSCADWIALPGSALSVKPGEAVTYTFVVRVPRGARGSYSAAVTWTSGPPAPGSPEKEGLRLSFGIRQRMCTVIHVTVGKPLGSRLRAEIVDLALDRGDAGELVVAATVANKGLFNAYAQGSLVVRNADRRRLRQVPLGHGTATIMPGNTVVFRTIFRTPPPPGSYSIDAIISYGDRRTARAQRAFEITAEGHPGATSPTVAALELAIEPASATLEVAAGGFASRTVTITNPRERAVRIAAGVKWLAVNETGDLIVAEEASAVRSARAWVQLGPTQFTVGPGQKRLVRVIARPPPGTSGGAYAAGVFTAQAVGARPDEKLLPTENTIPILVTVGRDAVTQLDVGQLQATVVRDFGEARFECKVRNTGLVHARIAAARLLIDRRRPPPEGLHLQQGDVQVLQPRETWDAVGEGRVGPAPQFLLPGHAVTIEADYVSALEPGEYRAVLLVSAEDGQSLQQTCCFEVPDRQQLSASTRGPDSRSPAEDGRSQDSAAASVEVGSFESDQGPQGAGASGATDGN